MATLNTTNIKHASSSTNNIVLNADGSTTIPNLSVGPNRNLIINGAMQVAQRGVSATGLAANGYATVDRFSATQSGTDDYIEQHQVDVSSGTTPYTEGFRKAFQIKNGNQTGGAGAADFISYAYRIESQDIANSGWNYNSASSFVTLSFWIKSSVAQTFKGYIKTHYSTQYGYSFETGSLTADTWTKITKTIPGNANLTFQNTKDVGFELVLGGFWGTDYTDNSVTENAWAAYANGTRMKDNTSTWYTTNDATLEITGVQLEVGSVATDFEHRSFGQELALCQRYFYQIDGSNNEIAGIPSGFFGSSEFFILIKFPVTMRATPSFTGSSTAFRAVGAADSGSKNLNNLVIWGTGLPTSMALSCNQTSGGTAGYAGAMQFQADNGFLQFSSEL